MKYLTSCLLGGAALWAGAAQAGPDTYICAPFTYVRVAEDGFGNDEVIVDAPFAHVRVSEDGPDEVIVDAPFVRLRIPRDRAEYFGPSESSRPADGVEELPPPEGEGLGVPAISLRDFARSFRPEPGDWAVTFVHPRTGELVDVYFTLPHDDLEDINLERDEIEFEYDDQEVKIEFRRDGRVRVEYDD